MSIRRAILADIHDLNLDPNKEYHAVGGDGRVKNNETKTHHESNSDEEEVSQEEHPSPEITVSKKDKKSKSRA